MRGYGRWWSLGEGVECRLGTPILLVHETSHTTQSQSYDPNDPDSVARAELNGEIDALNDQIDFLDEVLNQAPYSPPTNENAAMRASLEKFRDALKDDRDKKIKDRDALP